MFIKEVYNQLQEQGHIDVSYRQFTNWCKQFGFTQENLDEDAVAKLTQYCSLRRASTSYFFKNPEKKVALVHKLFTKMPKNEDGIKQMSGREFQEFLAAEGFMKRTQIYAKAKSVGVSFSTQSIITLGQAKKIILGVS